MSLGAVRNLSPEFVRDVLPILPPAPPPNAPFNRNHVAENMQRMGSFKDRALKTYWPQLIESVSIENIKISMRDGAEVDLRVYTPKKELPSGGSRRVVYSMHGGGFVAGNADSEDLINRQICSVCDVLVFSIEHRLAPEHPVVPVVLNDVEDGLKWVYANAFKYGGGKKEGLFVSGTSSGAAMAATLGFRAKSLGIPIKGLVLRQPVFIFNTYQKAAKKEWLPLLKSREENADSPILGANQVINLNTLIAIPDSEVRVAHNFPIFGTKEELSRMPPTYIVEAPCDPCVDEVELFARLLRDAGVTVKVRSYAGMPHGFHAHHVLQAARDEMNDTAAAVNWLIDLARQ